MNRLQNKIERERNNLTLGKKATKETISSPIYGFYLHKYNLQLHLSLKFISIRTFIVTNFAHSTSLYTNY